MSDFKYWDQGPIRLEEGTRYDVEALRSRVVDVEWSGANGDELYGYEWGYYFDEDGTYFGADGQGVEPRFYLVGKEPVAVINDEGGAE